MMILVFLLVLGSSAGVMAVQPQKFECEEKIARSVVDALLDRKTTQAKQIMQRWKTAMPNSLWLSLYDAMVLVAIADYAPSRDVARYNKPLEALLGVIAENEEKLLNDPSSEVLEMNVATAQAVAGRLMLEQGKWLRAFNHGYASRQTMKRLLVDHSELEDLRLILGMFEYLTGTIPASVRWLTYLINFSGDAEKGIKYLERVVEKAPIAAPQAAEGLLVEVKHSPEEACRYLPLAEIMRKTYPNNIRYLWAESRLQTLCEKAKPEERMPGKTFVLAKPMCPAVQ